MFQILGDAFFWLFVIVNLSALATLALSVMRWAATVLVFAILFSATLVTVSARFVLPVSGIRQWGGWAAFRSNVGRPWTLRRVGADKFGSHILATFSDSVFAIIVTIMVLQFKAQHDDNWRAVWGLARIFASYMLSFLFVAIHWTNHHDLMKSVTRLNAKIFWANTHLLFWLALIPFTTAWMTESHFSTAPVAAYGVIQLASAICYFLLKKAIITLKNEKSTIGTAANADANVKVMILFLLYIAGVVLSFVWPNAALVVYGMVTMMWCIRD
ncbi:MAG: TMEM175 family protein [Methylocella sp.]